MGRKGRKPKAGGNPAQQTQASAATMTAAQTPAAAQSDSKQEEVKQATTAKTTCHAANCAHANKESNTATTGAVYEEYADVVGVAPSFDIRDGNVVHQGSSGPQQPTETRQKANAGEIRRVNQKDSAQAPSNKMAQQAHPATHAQHAHRNYQNVDPQSDQPVVTMQDVIDQQQNKEQEELLQQQQMQKQQHGHRQGNQMHHHSHSHGHASHTNVAQYAHNPSAPQMVDQGIEADDEDCDEEEELDEEMDDEDTEEEDEDEYGNDEEQEDDFSEQSFGVVEDAEPAENDPRWQHSQQHPQHENAQGAYQNQQQTQTATSAQYQAYQQQQNQQYSNNTASQDAYQNQQYQQQYQQQQQQQQPQQQDPNAAAHYSQKQLQDAHTKLGSSLTDMLINLYNGKPTAEFQEHYATIAQILETKKRMQQKSGGGPEITAAQLLELFKQKIDGIVGTVKDKLQDDAKKDGLVDEVQPPPVSDNNAAPAGAAIPSQKKQQLRQQPQTEAKHYPKFQAKFDEILSAVGDYFELFKNNTNKLEDLWLQLLDYLKLQNPNACTVFKSTHYQTYIKKVISNHVIQKIIEEAKKWEGTNRASEHLSSYLEKIKEIEKEANFLPDSYETFKKKQHLDTDLNAYTRQMIENDIKMKQQQKEKQKQQQAAQQAQQMQQQKEGVPCNGDFNDCQQYQSHYKQYGCEKCRCTARNCINNHLNVEGQQKGHRVCAGPKTGARRTRAAQGSEKFRQQKVTPSQEFEGQQQPSGDEQVYKKDLDDLLAYIEGPKMKQTKKKGKNKRKQKDDSEEDAKSKSQVLASAGKSNNGSGGEKEKPKSVVTATGTTSSKAPASGTEARASPSHSKDKAQPRSTSTANGNVNGKPAADKVSSVTSSSLHNGVNNSSASESTASGSQDEVSNSVTDEQFETSMAAFVLRLETHCNEQVSNHARKMRPNYDGQWIFKLKSQLQRLDTQKQNPPRSAADGNKAAAGAGQTGKQHA